MSTSAVAGSGSTPVTAPQENVLSGNASVPGRRIHEIDALRSIALMLLIAYHALCAFQPFAWMLGLVGFSKHLPGLWMLGELLNTWRIPVLFLLAGVTAGHLLDNRQPTELLRSRLLRLVPPLLLGIFLIVPLSSIPFQLLHRLPVQYTPTSGHLWFVWNLVVNFVITFPLFVIIKRFPRNFLLRLLRVCSPYGWLIGLPGLLGLTTTLLEPHITPDYFPVFFIRFWYGLACFASGVLLVSLGDAFWDGIRRVCHPALLLGIALFVIRIVEIDVGGATVRLWANSFESAFGMLAFLGYGSLLLARPSPIFSRFNRAVFAIYIVHYPIQQAVALFLVTLGLPAWLAFVVLFVVTFAISALVYWLVLSFFPWLHSYFGIPPTKSNKEQHELPAQATLFPGGWMAVVGRWMVLYLVSPFLVIVTFTILVATALQSAQTETTTPTIQQRETNTQDISQEATLPAQSFVKDKDEP